MRKCPYCDFNSHTAQHPIAESAFIDALLADLAGASESAAQRPLTSVFIGGGTPSLLSGAAVRRLIIGSNAHIAFADAIEITLEANPGTADTGRFSDYRAAGVNRLSIGVQSFAADQLRALGRIHYGEEAQEALRMARTAGFSNINLDLMFGLPGQTPAQARRDMEVAVALEPEHISYYQLTLEPNTLFYNQPPPLPDEEQLWLMQEQGQEILARHGYQQYEISAYARDGWRCRHNLNYWQFGDYLGIGPGAHSKLTGRDGTAQRYWKRRQPDDYLRSRDAEGFISGCRTLDQSDLRLEFLMNALRLKQGVAPALFTARTGLPLEMLTASLAKPLQLNLIECSRERLGTTPKGYDFLNEVLAMV